MLSHFSHTGTKAKVHIGRNYYCVVFSTFTSKLKAFEPLELYIPKTVNILKQLNDWTN